MPSLPATDTPLLAARRLSKTYRRGENAVPVLRGVDLTIDAGELIAIVGQSGSGKSTLLHLLATLDEPDAGEVHLLGQRIDNLPRAKRDLIRNRSIGMVFQAYHLLPELTAIENVLAPAMIRYGVLAYWRERRQLRQRAAELLDLVGLGHRQDHRPRELSGGEMQRTAIARSLMNDPRLLLADEPTGNLDPATGEGVLDLLVRLNRERGTTVLMVTHDRSIAAAADRTITLVDGRVEAQAPPVLRLQA